MVRQSKRDYVEELTLLKKISDIYSETTINSWNEKVINKAVDLIGDLVNEVPIVCQHCTMEDEASFILHKYLDEEVRDGTI